MATKLLVVLALLALVMGLGGGHMAWAESNLGGGGSGRGPQRPAGLQDHHSHHSFFTVGDDRPRK